MITSIFIILLFLSYTRSFIFATDRINFYDMVVDRQKNGEPYTKEEQKMLIHVAFRFLIGIIYFGFIIYGFFANLVIYSALTIGTSIISFFLMRTSLKYEITTGTKILITRGDSFVKMLIWLTPLLQIIRSVF